MSAHRSLTVAALLGALALTASAQQLQKIVINFPTRSGASWPMYLAKEAGYYQKYGYDVTLQFGAHPAGIAMLVSGEAAMTNYSLEQALQAASKDGSLVMMGSSLNKGAFALMAAKNISKGAELKGKRFAVSQIGDAPYNYAIAILAHFGLSSRDVQWVPIGTDASGRAAALMSGRAEATLLTAPQYFKVEAAGYKVLANMAEMNDIYASTVYLFKKATLASNPKLAEALIKAHAEAIKRYYDDKPMAIKAYLAYDRMANPADVARVYDIQAKGQLMERIPYVLAGAVKSVLNQADSEASTRIRNYDFHNVIDNSEVDRLVKEGYFEKLFGPGIKAEEERKAKEAFR
ncbi:MAG TPA: ABC transporter substrate-binding protein [Bryobacteraceae bacterium]|jgi:ABC-type nitrate/sulfonate/bicarbonate transport system substrate-binding protein